MAASVCGLATPIVTESLPPASLSFSVICAEIGGLQRDFAAPSPPARPSAGVGARAARSRGVGVGRRHQRARLIGDEGGQVGERHDDGSASSRRRWRIAGAATAAEKRSPGVAAPAPSRLRARPVRRGDGGCDDARLGRRTGAQADALARRRPRARCGASRARGAAAAVGGRPGPTGYAGFAVGAFAARGAVAVCAGRRGRRIRCVRRGRVCRARRSDDFARGGKGKGRETSTARGSWGDGPPAVALGVAATRAAARAAGGATASDEFADVALKLACVALGAAAGPVLAEPGGMAAALAEAVLSGVASARSRRNQAGRGRDRGARVNCARRWGGGGADARRAPRGDDANGVGALCGRGFRAGGALRCETPVFPGLGEVALEGHVKERLVAVASSTLVRAAFDASAAAPALDETAVAAPIAESLCDEAAASGLQVESLRSAVAPDRLGVASAAARKVFIWKSRRPSDGSFCNCVFKGARCSGARGRGRPARRTRPEAAGHSRDSWTAGSSAEAGLSACLGLEARNGGVARRACRRRGGGARSRRRAPAERRLQRLQRRQRRGGAARAVVVAAPARLPSALAVCRWPRGRARIHAPEQRGEFGLAGRSRRRRRDGAPWRPPPPSAVAGVATALMASSPCRPAPRGRQRGDGAADGGGRRGRSRLGEVGRARRGDRGFAPDVLVGGERRRLVHAFDATRAPRRGDRGRRRSDSSDRRRRTRPSAPLPPCAESARRRRRAARAPRRLSRAPPMVSARRAACEATSKRPSSTEARAMASRKARRCSAVSSSSSAENLSRIGGVGAEIEIDRGRGEALDEIAGVDRLAEALDILARQKGDAVGIAEIADEQDFAAQRRLFDQAAGGEQTREIEQLQRFLGVLRRQQHRLRIGELAAEAQALRVGIERRELLRLRLPPERIADRAAQQIALGAGKVAALDDLGDVARLAAAQQIDDHRVALGLGLERLGAGRGDRRADRLQRCALLAVGVLVALAPCAPADAARRASCRRAASADRRSASAAARLPFALAGHGRRASASAQATRAERPGTAASRPSPMGGGRPRSQETSARRRPLPSCALTSGSSTRISSRRLTAASGWAGSRSARSA